MFHVRENIVARKIHNSYFLINIEQNYSNDKCFLFEINEVGYHIWKLMELCLDIDEIVNELYEKVDREVAKDILAKDVKEYMLGLMQEGFVE